MRTPTLVVFISALVLAVLGVSLSMPWLKTPVLVALSNGLAVAGVIVLIRAGQVSFGHAMYACLAGYAVAFAGRAWHLDALLLIAMGTAAAAAAGAVIGLFMVRYRGIFFGMLNLAFSMVLFSVLGKFGAVTGGTDGLRFDRPTFGGVVLGTVVSIAASALIGVFMVRYRGIFFGMLNLAFSMVLFSVLGKFGGLTGGTDGLRFDRPAFAGMVMEREDFETALLGLGLVLAVGGGILVMRYFASVTGQCLAALKTNETRLEYLGISAKHVFWGGYVLSATLCGLGGTLFALTQGLVTPDMGYWVRSGELVFIAILGGSGHALGAFIGAFVFEFVKLYAASLLTGAWQLALGIVLIVMVFVAPKGLYGLLVRRCKPPEPQPRAVRNKNVVKEVVA